MAFRIGTTYRYSNKKDESIIPEAEQDGMPNFYYETFFPGHSTITFQRGIHPIKTVISEDGHKRIPAVIISSSPHKARTEMTPWQDDFNPDHGHIKYFGDNKSREMRPEETDGNACLLKLFSMYSAPDRETRLKAAPLIFFKRVVVDGRPKGNLMFEGFGIIENVQLITQFDPKLKNSYFTNYVFDMCVFSMTHDNEEFSWEWINQRRLSTRTDEELLSIAPHSWKTWVEEGSTSLYKVRRSLSVAKTISTVEQCPEPNSIEESILMKIYNHYSDSKHIFEMLAMRVAQEIFEEEGISFRPGWITQKSGDKGIDFVARLDISAQMSKLNIVVLGQAKCQRPDLPTNGRDIARTVARLKRGWFGV